LPCHQIFTLSLSLPSCCAIHSDSPAFSTNSVHTASALLSGCTAHFLHWVFTRCSTDKDIDVACANAMSSWVSFTCANLRFETCSASCNMCVSTSCQATLHVSKEVCDGPQAVQVMTKICAESERSLDYYGLFKQIMKRAPVPMSPLESLASSAVRTAHKVCCSHR